MLILYISIITGLLAYSTPIPFLLFPTCLLFLSEYFGTTWSFTCCKIDMIPSLCRWFVERALLLSIGMSHSIFIGSLKTQLLTPYSYFYLVSQCCSCTSVAAATLLKSRKDNPRSSRHACSWFFSTLVHSAIPSSMP